MSKLQLMSMSESLTLAKIQGSKADRDALITLVRDTLDYMAANYEIIELPKPIGLEVCAPISLEWMAERRGYREGWNNAITEVKRLNDL